MHRHLCQCLTVHLSIHLTFLLNVLTFCWNILLEHSVGTFCWNILLEHFVGTFCCNIMLEHFAGTFHWDSWLEHKVRAEPLGPRDLSMFGYYFSLSQGLALRVHRFTIRAHGLDLRARGLPLRAHGLPLMAHRLSRKSATSLGWQ